MEHFQRQRVIGLMFHQLCVFSDGLAYSKWSCTNEDLNLEPNRKMYIFLSLSQCLCWAVIPPSDAPLIQWHTTRGNVVSQWHSGWIWLEVFPVRACVAFHRCHYPCPTFCYRAVLLLLLWFSIPCLVLLKEACSDNGGQMPGEQWAPDKTLISSF